MVLVSYGRPSKIRFPRSLQRFTVSWSGTFCASIPVMKTMSAHSIWESFSRSMFMSTNRRSQERGNNPETVSSPSGGNTERLPSNGSAYRKLQQVSGNSGLTSKIFIASSSAIWAHYSFVTAKFLNEQIATFMGIADVRLRNQLGRVIVV